MELVAMGPELAQHVGDGSTHYVEKRHVRPDGCEVIQCAYVGSEQGCIRFMFEKQGLRSVQ